MMNAHGGTIWKTMSQWKKPKECTAMKAVLSLWVRRGPRVHGKKKDMLITKCTMIWILLASGSQRIITRLAMLSSELITTFGSSLMALAGSGMTATKDLIRTDSGPAMEVNGVFPEKRLWGGTMTWIGTVNTSGNVEHMKTAHGIGTELVLSFGTVKNGTKEVKAVLNGASAILPLNGMEPGSILTAGPMEDLRAPPRL